MYEFKGTKGPWSVHDWDGCLEIVAGENINPNTVATILNRHKEIVNCYSESEANALLISKAPELLEMLKDIKDYLGSDRRQEVEQLIKEATEI